MKISTETTKAINMQRNQSAGNRCRIPASASKSGITITQNSSYSAVGNGTNEDTGAK